MNALEKRAVETSLYRFIKWAWPLVDPAPFVDSKHIWIVCKYLEAVTMGEIPKLAINIPPGHQKSLTVSVFWPVWTWLLKPGRRFMNTSYRGDLALRDADRSRDLIRHPVFQEEFGDRFKLRKGQDIKSRYANDQRGYRFSTAIAGIMGEGGDYVVLDDPHNVETAESDGVRDETVRKIRLALPTRVRSRDGAVVLMMQRLHSRDFCGVVFAQEEGWVHVCLPARFDPTHPFLMPPTIQLTSGRVLPGDWRTEEGELLWPELFGEERLSLLENALGSYGVAGQLQQLPVPREGGLFKRAWFDGKFVDVSDVPIGVTVRGWDLAAGDNAAADYSASCKIRKAEGNYYIMHAARFKREPLKVKQEMKRLAEQDGHAVQVNFPQDPGQAGKSQRQDLVANLDGFNVRYSPESGDKVTRAEGLSAQAEGGNVYLVRDDWNDPFLDEICMFPGGENDDFMDAASRAYHALKNAAGPSLGLGGQLIGG